MKDNDKRYKDIIMLLNVILNHTRASLNVNGQVAHDVVTDLSLIHI